MQLVVQELPYYFNPHSPRRLCRTIYGNARTRLISIHTALAGCDQNEAVSYMATKISIHTALAGCDRHWKMESKYFVHFNPHSPRRLWQGRCILMEIIRGNFNPHSPRRLWRQISPIFLLKSTLSYFIFYTFPPTNQPSSYNFFLFPSHFRCECSWDFMWACGSHFVTYDF